MKPFENLTRFQKILLHIFGLILGAALGTFVVFQILFLAHVLPHGGI